MANFLSNLLDRDNPIKKLQKEIEGMELKKQSLIASVQNEINRAKQLIDNTFYQIGSDVYKGRIDEENIDDKLAEHFNSIESFNTLIAEKESKIKEITSRYDEEIGMLNSHLAQTQQQGAAPGSYMAIPSNTGAESGPTCPGCGKPYTPGSDLFCMGCGKKLSKG